MRVHRRSKYLPTPTYCGQKKQPKTSNDRSSDHKKFTNIACLSARARGRGEAGGRRAFDRGEARGRRGRGGSGVAQIRWLGARLSLLRTDPVKTRRDGAAVRI
uniref:Uncharacterized protein n=1 Tax=Arundo donax TaxID=35708 RepID=A0A0A9FCJ8_ARUDO